MVSTLDLASTEHLQAAAARHLASLGVTHRRIADAIGVQSAKTVQRRLRLLDGPIPKPSVVLGSTEPGHELASEAGTPGLCPVCGGQREEGDYCLGCQSYEGYDARLAAERARDQKRAKAAAKFKPRVKG